MLTHRFTWTESRDIGGLKFPKIMFFDGQGFVVAKKSKVNKIADLNNATICTLQGSTSELIVASYFGAHKLKYKIVTFASAEQAWDAFVGKRCDTVINDRSGLAARLAKLPNKDDYRVLAETVSNEPIGPIVAQGQPRWEALVRFTLNALVAAEELGITQANVDEQRNSQNPDVQRLLGASGRLRQQARRRQRLRVQGDQGRRQLRRDLGPQRRTEDSPAAGPRTQRARGQRRPDDVDPGPLITLVRSGARPATLHDGSLEAAAFARGSDRTAARLHRSSRPARPRRVACSGAPWRISR